ncbi:hypothetical protein [Caenispirillum bisanense]|uniref:hypothetical protein n=1 Tax=Caenispirillum bisanense TaxID=414052 RepID=UPI0031D70CB1
MMEQGNCPVLRDGRELARINNEVNRVIEERDRLKQHSPDHSRLEIVEAHLLDCENALRKRVLDGRAGSLGGALAQLVVMFHEVDMIVSHLYGPCVPADVRHSIEERFRRVERAAYSILRVVEAGAQMDRDEVAGDTFMSRHLDPHERIREWRTGIADAEPGKGG